MKIRVLLVVMMFGWAGCTQQEEPVDEFFQIGESDKNMLIEHWKKLDSTKFDPTKHYITRVDTVGFERIQIIVDSYVTEGPVSIYQGDTTQLAGTWHNIYDSVWAPILDTSFAAKQPLLLTPEELRKIRGMLSVYSLRLSP